MTAAHTLAQEHRMSAMNRLATLLFAAVLTVPALAQQVPAEQQGRPAGAPDLFAVWKPAALVASLKTVDGKQPPLNAAGKALYAKRVAARAAGKPIDDTTLECLPHGMPRLMLSPYPFRIVQKPKFVAFVHELHHMYRVVYLDEPNKPLDDLDPTFMGYPAAKYEGDTLVVTSNGFNDETTLDRAGLPKSAELKLTEKYKVINGGKQLEGVFTIEDPKYYSRTWSARQVFERGAADSGFDEYVCTDVNPEARAR
jgi:hypothetical protein